MTLEKDNEVRGQFDRRRFDRRELVQLKLRAEYLARQPNQNVAWETAYRSLAQAATVLDSFIYQAIGQARERQEIDEDFDPLEE